MKPKMLTPLAMILTARPLYALVTVAVTFACLCQPRTADAQHPNIVCSQCDLTGDLWLYYDSADGGHQSQWPVYVGVDEYDSSGSELPGYPQYFYFTPPSPALPTNDTPPATYNVTCSGVPSEPMVSYSISGPAVAGEIGVLGGVSRDTGSGVGWLMKRGCPSVRLCSGKTGLDRERTPSWHMESFSVCCCKETWFRQSPRRERFKSGTRRGCGRWSQD